MKLTHIPMFFATGLFNGGNRFYPLMNKQPEMREGFTNYLVSIFLRIYSQAWIEYLKIDFANARA